MVDLKKIYDAIVVGSGAAGGIATKELTEGGLQVLLLEAGPNLDPLRDFRTHRWPYEMPFRGFDRPGDREKFYPNQIYTDEYTRALYRQSFTPAEEVCKIFVEVQKPCSLG